MDGWMDIYLFSKLARPANTKGPFCVWCIPAECPPNPHIQTDTHTHTQLKCCCTNLLDAVGVDGGLRLQDADRLRLLGALRHLSHLLGDEIVDAVQRLHRPLDQTHSLCRSCNTHTEKHKHKRRQRLPPEEEHRRGFY